MIYLPKRQKCFVLIPKNASESLRELFKDREDMVRIKIDNNDHVDVNTAINAGIVHLDTKFIGIVRNPFERQLSLYLYRQRDKRYTEKLSVEDFRSKIITGCIKDHPWQMQLQCTYMEYNGTNVGKWYRYENAAQSCAEYGVLPQINKSSNRNTKDLVDVFYDADSKKAVETYWQRDFELYESVKNANRTSGYRN
jgi:hypothetical protein